MLVLDFVEDTPVADAARSRFGIERETFTVVLVGKDGGEKFRYTEPILPQDLFDRVDAMPMRQREMREKNAG